MPGKRGGNGVIGCRTGRRWRARNHAGQWVELKPLRQGRDDDKTSRRDPASPRQYGGIRRDRLMHRVHRGIGLVACQRRKRRLKGRRQSVFLLQRPPDLVDLGHAQSRAVEDQFRHIAGKCLAPVAIEQVIHLVRCDREIDGSRCRHRRPVHMQPRILRARRRLDRHDHIHAPA